MKRPAKLILVLVAALLLISFFAAELFGDAEGSDDQAQALALSLGAEAHMQPLFEPPAEAERWLFALQGFIGAGLLWTALAGPGRKRRKAAL